MPPKPRGPEDVSFEIGASYIPVPNALGLDDAEEQVFACLHANRREIIDAELAFGVTRVAIAGAIAWEMLENVRRWSPRSVGFGKVHLYNYHLTRSWFDTAAKQAEDQRFIPAQSDKDRQLLLATPAGAIRYIAAIMAAIADIAGREGFDDIRFDPEILTNVYQSMDLKDWEAHVRKKAKGTKFTGGNKMDRWVMSHLLFLTSAVGTPIAPLTPPSGGMSLPAARVVVVQGDTLSGLAGKHYGAQEYWPLIWDFNRRNVGPNPNRLVIGTPLDLPPLSSFSHAQLDNAKRRHATWKTFPHAASIDAHHGAKGGH